MKYLIVKSNAKTRDGMLGDIAKAAVKAGIASSAAKLKAAYLEREKLGTTGFEAGVAVPHARIESINENAIIIARNTAGVDWKSIDGKPTTTAISINVKKSGNAGSEHMDILSKVATDLMEPEKRKIYKSGTVAQIEALSKAKEEVKSSVKKSKVKVIGISACATGVAHTYMAQKALIKAGDELGYQTRIETQGQKGQESTLTDEEIAEADVVVIAADINVELDRFDGKKVFLATTNDAINNGKNLIQKALKNGVTHKAENGGVKISGGKRGVMSHILSGVSRMIPFIVFSGIVWAILNAVTQAGVSSPELDLAIKGASVGFTFFIAMMGGFIGESVGGRAAFAPAAIATFVASDASFFWDWNGIIPDVFARNTDFSVIKDAATGAGLVISTGWTIVGAIIFGLSAGKLVQAMNKIKLPAAASALLPILIIPVVATSILVFPIVFVVGAPINWLLSSFGMLIGIAGQITGLNFVIGFFLGAMIGFDMGGPVNKIAGATATALIQVDPRLLGAVEAAIPIAPLGAGLATLIGGKTFDKSEKALGIAALPLGFFGISEGAIPFAARRPKATIITNVIASAIAGGLSFMFFVGGHVGMWGGPIVALVLGVYADAGQLGYHIPDVFGGSSQYLSILWFFVAIAAGTVIHSFLYLFLIKRFDAGKGLFTKKPMQFRKARA